nr:hypothetical protein OG690_38700 [Streptomyces tubercidicus]
MSNPRGEIPRDASGARLCQHCLERTVPESLGTKPRSYCSRNCRQRAYETRKQTQVVKQAIATVEAARAARAATSRDVAGQAAAGVPATSRDVAAAPSVDRSAPAPAVPRPTVPLPDMSKPKSQRRSLFPSFKVPPRSEQGALFEDQADAEG